MFVIRSVFETLYFFFNPISRIEAKNSTLVSGMFNNDIHLMSPTIYLYLYNVPI